MAQILVQTEPADRADTRIGQGPGPGDGLTGEGVHHDRIHGGVVNLHHREGLSYLVASSNGTKGFVRGLRAVATTLDQPRIEASYAHFYRLAGDRL